MNVAEYTTEQLMDYVIFTGSQEWKDCNASIIIGDIIAAFNEYTGRNVQFISLWQDVMIHYICLGVTTIRHMLNILAQHTGSTIVFQDAGVSFIEDKSA